MMTSSNGNIFHVTGPLCGEFLSQRPVTRSFDFFYLHLNKRLSKQSWGWWIETPSRSLWRHCNDKLLNRDKRLRDWQWKPWKYFRRSINNDIINQLRHIFDSDVTIGMVTRVFFFQNYKASSFRDFQKLWKQNTSQRWWLFIFAAVGYCRCI